jgi:putative hydrolase of the HAD superfamily
MTDDFTSTINEVLSPLRPIPPDISPLLKTPGNIKAVLFDIYGTLLVSGTGDISLASLQRDTLDMNSILSECGFSPLFESCTELIPELINRFIKERHEELQLLGVDYPEVEIRDIWRKVLRELWEKGSLKEDPGNKSVDLLALRHELSVNPVWPMPGFPEIVRSLKDAGFRIGIVSNAQFYTPLIIEALTGKKLEEMGFEAELCAWSYREQRAKPSPEIFTGPLMKLSETGIEASEVLYIGNDMRNDVACASAAGCRTVLFAGDRRSLRLREGENTVEPDMIITGLTELESLIT